MVLWHVRGRLGVCEFISCSATNLEMWCYSRPLFMNILSLLLSMCAYVTLFICAIHSGVSSGFQQGFWKLLRPFSSAAYSIQHLFLCTLHKCCDDTHVFKMYECCVKLLRHTPRMSQGLACERMCIFSLCRRPGNKLYYTPKCNLKDPHNII